MKQALKQALEQRRTYYSLSNQSLISDAEIQEIIEFALMHVPSAFNSQSTRIVLLLGKHHAKLWNIVEETLQKVVPADSFAATKAKIETSFASGYGTVLFFEDQSVVTGLQEAFPSYKDYFPLYSERTAGMHQLVIWTLLENSGFGASMQHYQPLIDETIQKEWGIDSNWRLMAQMPFGVPTAQPGDKTHQPLENRLKVFK